MTRTDVHGYSPTAATDSAGARVGGTEHFRNVGGASVLASRSPRCGPQSRAPTTRRVKRLGTNACPGCFTPAPSPPFRKAGNSFRKSIAVISGKRQPPFNFFRPVRKHPVVKARPLGIARVKLLVRKFACFRATPSFGGETAQRARPAAVCIIESIRVQTGEKIRDAAPNADERRV
jgi:hypothetical protein